MSHDKYAFEIEHDVVEPQADRRQFQFVVVKPVWPKTATCQHAVEK